MAAGSAVRRAGLLGRWSLRPRDELRESELPLRLWLFPLLLWRLWLFPLLLWRCCGLLLPLRPLLLWSLLRLSLRSLRLWLRWSRVCWSRGVHELCVPGSDGC